MGEREEIRKRVEDFRKFQERLCREREERIQEINQKILRTLQDMRAHYPRKP